jgi:hypothetical protein
MQGTNCPNQTALFRRFVEVDATSSKVIVSLGCNKGIGVAELYAQYSPTGTFSASQFKRALLSRLLELKISDPRIDVNGVCDQMHPLTDQQPANQKPRDRGGGKGPLAICVDALPSNVALVAATWQQVVDKSASFGLQASNFVIQADESPATQPFPVNEAGYRPRPVLAIKSIPGHLSPVFASDPYPVLSLLYLNRAPTPSTTK